MHCPLSGSRAAALDAERRSSRSVPVLPLHRLASIVDGMGHSLGAAWGPHSGRHGALMRPREKPFRRYHIRRYHVQRKTWWPVAGDTVFSQGDAVDGFYIVVSGECVVQATQRPGHPPKEIAKLGPGDFFGETGLLEGRAVRNSSVLCTTPVEVAHPRDQNLPGWLRWQSCFEDALASRRWWRVQVLMINNEMFLHLTEEHAGTAGAAISARMRARAEARQARVLASLCQPASGHAHGPTWDPTPHSPRGTPASGHAHGPRRISTAADGGMCHDWWGVMAAHAAKSRDRDDGGGATAGEARAQG